MKKLLSLFFLILLVTPLILAEENSVGASATPDENSPSQDSVGVMSSTDSNADNSILEKSKELIETPREIKIPDSLKKIYRTIFNLESSDNLDINQLILLTLIFIFFLLIFHSVISSLSSFSNILSGITSLVLTFIFAILGGIVYVARLISGFDSNKVSWLWLILLAIGFFVLFFILNKIFKKIKQSSRLSKATEDGRVVGTEIAKLKAIAEVDRVGNEI